MLSSELQPAVRQLVERNEQLENEKEELYEKVHELLTENTALKATRHKFREDCQSLVANQASQLLSPSREMKQRIHQQKRQIQNLQSQLTESQSQVEELQKAISELEQQHENEADTIERAEQIEIDAAEECKEIIQQLHRLIPDSKENEEENEPTLKGQLKIMKKRIQRVQQEYSDFTSEKQTLNLNMMDYKQRISDLETENSVLKTEKETTAECNQRYEKERAELTQAITTLRKALGELKTNLTTAEQEKDLLKKENIRLTIENNNMKNIHSMNNLDSDDDTNN